MVVNPFFLHGSSTEQNLMQDLVNEQLRMYGMDVYYIPREFIREATIMREVTSSKFNTYFIIEAYLNNFDGFGGQGDLMSKFGIQVKDEITLTISRERYENYVAPFLNSRLLYLLENSDSTTLQTIHRPKEGDLIYFPLGRRLFEIKFVEHEQPFYQLGKGYTYELQCELFEYEDEVIDTTIDEIDTSIQTKGYITTLDLIPVSDRAEVDVNLATGVINELTILNEGNNYNSAPEIVIDPPEVGDDPRVVALLTLPDSNVDTPAVKQLITFKSGYGYVEVPNVVASGGGGNGTIIRAGISSGVGVVNFPLIGQGAGYAEDAAILVYDSENNVVAEGLALTDGIKIVDTIVISAGDNIDPDGLKAVVAAPASSGEGDYIYNEIIVGKKSGTEARVRGWNGKTKELQVTNLDIEKDDIFFQPGEIIEGKTSGARYSVSKFNDDQASPDAYAQNEEIEDVAKEVVDREEYNQFMPYTLDEFDSDNPFGE